LQHSEQSPQLRSGLGISPLTNANGSSHLFRVKARAVSHLAVHARARLIRYPEQAGQSIPDFVVDCQTCKYFMWITAVIAGKPHELD
jgi:hypothetical protein